VSARGDATATSTFFRSRWVEAPAGGREKDPARLAPGFRAAGISCGLKAGGGTDLGLVACDSAEVISALLLTRNAAAAAPIRVCRDHLTGDRIRAAIVNSGNANAATGEQGLADAMRMRDEAAEAIGACPEEVAVAETGVIGVPLDIGSISAGIGRVVDALSERGGRDFTEAISTTDRWSKLCSVELDGVTVSAQAKGAGMIQPGFATLLCFVQTDAVVLDAEVSLRRAVAGSFERITVDGQLSTNDTVLLQASGEAGRALPDGLLDAILLQLAIEVVADGEGASRVALARVRSAADAEEADRVARAIANSPLVKTALLGRDPNWGRIAQAAGMALAGEDLRELGPDQIEATELAGPKSEVELTLTLDRGDAEAGIWFSDLTHDYVSLNAEYTT